MRTSKSRNELVTKISSNEVVTNLSFKFSYYFHLQRSLLKMYIESSRNIPNVTVKKYNFSPAMRLLDRYVYHGSFLVVEKF